MKALFYNIYNEDTGEDLNVGTYKEVMKYQDQHPEDKIYVNAYYE